MWRTSARGRIQFSVENPNTVSQPMSRRTATRTRRARFSSPSVCPAVRARPRRPAQRPLPSMMHATWSGGRPGGEAAAVGVTVRPTIRPGCAVIRMPAGAEHAGPDDRSEAGTRSSARIAGRADPSRGHRSLGTVRPPMSDGRAPARAPPRGKLRAWVRRSRTSWSSRAPVATGTSSTTRPGRGWRRRSARSSPTPAGAWLTLRAYEAGDDGRRRRAGRRTPGRRHLTTADGRCTIIVDPVSDGRERFAEAMRHLPPAVVVDEKAVTGVLYEPADVEPDLVLVLGPPTRLPPSLVWELAYSELVFSTGRPRRPAPRAPAAGDRRLPRAAAPLRRPRHVTTRCHRDQPPRTGDDRRRAAHVQARRGRPHRRAADGRERQGPGRRQGRPQDEVQVRRPARADEPRPRCCCTAAASSTSSARPSRSSRWPRCWPASTRASQGMAVLEAADQLALEREPNPSCTGCSSACCARSPTARPARRAGVLLEAAGRRGPAARARRLRALRRGRARRRPRRVRPHRGRRAVPVVPVRHGDQPRRR